MTCSSSGQGSVSDLHCFLDKINQLHPTIKFTLTRTKRAGDDSDNCGCPVSESIAFLDTSLSIRNSSISVDLYRKPSDRCTYLLPSSCHPPHTTKNIPFSLALGIVRICSDTQSRDLRLGAGGAPGDAEVT